MLIELKDDREIESTEEWANHFLVNVNYIITIVIYNNVGSDDKIIHGENTKFYLNIILQDHDETIMLTYDTEKNRQAVINKLLSFKG